MALRSGGELRHTTSRFAAALLLLLISFSIHDGALSQTVPSQSSGPGAPSLAPESERELRRLNEVVLEVRRDQLNYRIERDLLKETYSSNIQTINSVLAIILGAFTILGYLGLRSLGSLRSDFQRDLEQFRTARSQLDEQVKALERDQELSNTQVKQLKAENREQNKRLRSLEVREKAGALIAQDQYSLALEYLGIGLEMTPDDVVMLRQRAQCLTYLDRMTEAITANEAVLKVKPDDRGAITDLAEFYLLSQRFRQHDAIVETHRDVLEARSPVFLWYLEALKLLMKGQGEKLPAHLSTLLATVPHDKTNKIRGWRFAEVRTALARRDDLVNKELFLRVLDFLEGKVEAAAVIPAKDDDSHRV